MSDNPVASINSQSEAPPVQPTAPSASDPVTAAAAASMSSTPHKSKFNTLESLKEYSPKLYNLIIQSLTENMRRDMQNHQDRLKKAIRGEDN